MISNRLSAFAGDNITKEFDYEYFVESITHGQPVSEKTPHPKIKRAIFGQILHFSLDSVSGLKLKKFRPWNPSKIVKNFCDSEDVVRLNELLYDSIKPFITIKKNIACEFSGGLDSSGVFYMLKKQNISLKGLSVVSTLKNDDGDTDFIERFSETHKNELVLIDSAKYPLIKRSNYRSADEPGGEIGSAIRENLIRELNLNKIDILMSGLGGDQVFASTDSEPFFVADHFFHPKLRKKLLSEWIQRSDSPRTESYYLYHYGVRTWFNHLRNRLITSPRYSDEQPEWLTEDGRDMAGAVQHNSLLFKNWKLPPGRQQLWQDIFYLSLSESSSASTLLPAHYHHPYLYLPLVEFMLSTSYFNRRLGNNDRILYRKAMKGILPESIMTRKSKGTSQRDLDWLFKEDNPILEELFQSVLVEVGIFDESLWHTCLKRARFGAYHNLSHLLSALSIELWIRREYEVLKMEFESYYKFDNKEIEQDDGGQLFWLRQNSASS
jgi:asparagine synthase (glutamine-hydrolysing)